MNDANLVGGCSKTVKMSINSAKSRFVVDRGCKLTLFPHYYYVKEGHSVFVLFFFIFYSKIYVGMTMK